MKKIVHAIAVTTVLCTLNLLRNAVIFFYFLLSFAHRIWIGISIEFSRSENHFSPPKKSTPSRELRVEWWCALCMPYELYEVWPTNDCALCPRDACALANSQIRVAIKILNIFKTVFGAFIAASRVVWWTKNRFAIGMASVCGEAVIVVSPVLVMAMVKS